MLRMTAIEDTPDRVTVSGTESTPDAEVTMLEGATGARIPTGEHRPSVALPSTTSSSDGNGAGIIALVAMIAVVAALAIAIYFVAT